MSGYFNAHPGGKLEKKIWDDENISKFLTFDWMGAVFKVLAVSYYEPNDKDSRAQSYAAVTNAAVLLVALGNVCLVFSAFLWLCINMQRGIGAWCTAWNFIRHFVALFYTSFLFVVCRIADATVYDDARR